LGTEQTITISATLQSKIHSLINIFR